MSRPSASVLLTSIVLPFFAVTMSPGLTAWPLGMFSVDGHHRRDRRRDPELGDAGHRLDHRGAARHVELHLLHLGRGLDRDPAGVEGHRLADEAEVRTARRGRAPAQHDQPRVDVRSPARPRRMRPCRWRRSRHRRAARPRGRRTRRRSPTPARRGRRAWRRSRGGSAGPWPRWPRAAATRARSTSSASTASPLTSSDSIAVVVVVVGCT